VGAGSIVFAEHDCGVACCATKNTSELQLATKDGEARGVRDEWGNLHDERTG
jgi:hypothetical protein